MKKIISKINYICRLLILDKETKRFILHNRKVWRSYNNDCGNSVILMDLFDVGEAHIARSYFLNILAKKHKAGIKSFGRHTRLPQRVLRKVYRSFNVNGHIVTTLSKEQNYRRKTIMQEVMPGLKTKQDIFNLKVLDIWIGIDIYVHDGFTGALLFQQRYADTVIGDVWIPATYAVGSERLNSTSTVEKRAHIIDQASTDIRQTLSCYPFITRIVDIKDDKVFIDAGAQEKLNVGDQLVVYSTSGDDLNLEGGLSFIGKDKQPAGVLTLLNVTPRYSIGRLEVPARELGIRVGDWVKSW